MNGTISQSISTLSRRIENINVSNQKLSVPINNKVNQLKGQYNNYKLDKLEIQEQQEQKEFSDNSEHQGNSTPVNADSNDSNVENLLESSNNLQQTFNNKDLFSLESDKENSINDSNVKSDLLETNDLTEETNENNKDVQNDNDSIGESDDYESDSESEKNEQTEENGEKESLDISQISDIDINEQTDEDTEVLTDKIKNEIKNLEQLEETVYPSITPDELEKMTVRELKTFAANNSIVQKGTKKELLTRVKEKLNLE